MCPFTGENDRENLEKKKLKSLKSEIRKLKSKISREEKYSDKLKSELEDTSIPEEKEEIRQQIMASTNLLVQLRSESVRLKAPGVLIFTFATLFT